MSENNSPRKWRELVHSYQLEYQSSVHFNDFSLTSKFRKRFIPWKYTITIHIDFLVCFTHHLHVVTNFVNEHAANFICFHIINLTRFLQRKQDLKRTIIIKNMLCPFCCYLNGTTTFILCQNYRNVIVRKVIINVTRRCDPILESCVYIFSHKISIPFLTFSGKSTFMKILGGDLEPTLGNVSLDPNERIGKLRQDQFAFEEFTVLDTVIMGHAELWEVKQERDRIYALAEMSEEDGYKVADLETQYGEMDGYSAEARAGELLLGVGIPVEQHYGPMSEVAPGWKLRVLLAQALFSNPDILLLDEPTNNLDIDTIRWLEQTLNDRDSTMIIISHDRHFLNMVCTHMADLDYGELRVYPGNYDEYMTAATQARERLLADNAKKKAQIADLQSFVSRFSANASKSRQATSRAQAGCKCALRTRLQG